MPEHKPLNLVLMDDDYVIRFVVKKMLNSFFPAEALNVFTSADGVKGLGYVFLTRPEIIIVDTTLPQYSGMEIVDFLKSNQSFGSSLVVVMHNGTEIKGLPINYVQLNKGQSDFLELLLNHVSQKVGIKKAEGTNSFIRWFRKSREVLARKTLLLANKSDKAAYTLEHRKRIIDKVRWLKSQIVTSLYLSCFYLFINTKDTDTNIEQSNQDLQAFRVRVFPALTALFATVSVCFLQLVLVTGTFLGVFSIRQHALAVTYTWDGGGVDNNWSTCANWNVNICPVAGDTVIFDATSTKNSTVDAGYHGTIVTININAGYTGTIDLQRSLTVNSAITQSDGTFNAGSQTVDVNGNFTVNAGATHIASTGNSTFAGAFTVADGTFTQSGGTITFDGSSSAAITCNTGNTFALIAFGNSSNTKTVAASCNFPIGNNPVWTGAGLVTINGTISGTGTLTKSLGTLTFGPGTPISGITGLVAGTVNNTGNLDFSAYTVLSASGAVTTSAGSMIVPNGADFNGALSVTGGTFDAPSGSMTVAGAFTISGAAVFNHNNGTLIFDGTGVTLSCNNATFNFVTFAHTTGNKTISANCTFPIGANPNYTTAGGFIISGVLVGSGTFTSVGQAFFNSASSALSGFTGINTGSNGVSVGGANMDFSAYTTFVAGTVSITSGSMIMPSAGADINGVITVAGGTFTASTGVITAGNISISGAGVFNHNNGTMTIDGSSTFTLSCNNATFNLVTFNNTGSRTVSSNCNLPLGNNPTLAGTGAITLSGTFTGTGTITSNVSGANTFTAGALLSGFTGWTQSAGSFNVTGNFDASALTSISTNSFTHSAGTFVAPNGTLAIKGSLLLSGAGVFTHNNGIVEFSEGASIVTLSCNSQTFNEVAFSHTTIAKTVSSNCTLPLGTDPTITGPVTLNGTLAGAGTLTIADVDGNFIISTGSNLTGFSGIHTDIFYFQVTGTKDLDLSGYTSFTGDSHVSVETSTATLTLPDNANLDGSLTINGTFNAPSGNLHLGNSMFINPTGVFNHSGGTLVLDPVNFGPSYHCNNVTFNLVQIDAALDGDLNQYMHIRESCTFPLGNNPTVDLSDSTPGHLLIIGDNGYGASTLTGTGLLTVSGNLTHKQNGTFTGFTGVVIDHLAIEDASVDYSGLSPVDIGIFELADTSTFGAPAVMTISGDIYNNYNNTNGPSNFIHNNGTVVLDGGNQTFIDYAQDADVVWTFHNLTKSVTSPATLTFLSAGVNEFSVAGTLTLEGSSSSNKLSLRSDDPGTQWIIDPQGAIDVAYVDVQDGNNINATTIDVNCTGTDSGNNTNWNFCLPEVTNLGPAGLVSGSYATDSTPTFTFNVTDGDVGAQIKFRIQIDNNSDFSSPLVDYTSANQAQGNTSFTVGQAVGSGTYTVGNAGQTLSEGSFYWRVGGIDFTNQAPTYESANSGNIAFIIDSTAPTGSVSIDDDPDSIDPLDIVINISGNDNIGVTQMMISEDSNFAGASWESFATSKDYSFAESGTHTIYLKLRDAAGNESATYNDTIIIGVPPVDEEPTEEPEEPVEEPPVEEPPVEEPPTEEPVGGEIQIYKLIIQIVDLGDMPIAGALVNIGDQTVTTDSNGNAVFNEIEKGDHVVIIDYRGKRTEYPIEATGPTQELEAKLMIEIPAAPLPLLSGATLGTSVKILSSSITVSLSTLLLVSAFSASTQSIFGIGIIRSLPLIIWKKVKRPWGIILDQETGEPVPLAKVTAFKDDLFVKDTIADLNGRYRLSLEPGLYKLKFEHYQYGFKEIEINMTDADMRVAVDMWLHSKPSKWLVFLRKISSKLPLVNKVVFVIGLVTAGVAVALSIDPLNLVIISIYLVSLVIYVVRSLANRKFFGVVLDHEGKPVSGASVRLIDDANTIVDVLSTDTQGHFAYPLKDSSAFTKIHVFKQGYTFPSSLDNAKAVPAGGLGVAIPFATQEIKKGGLRIALDGAPAAQSSGGFLGA